MIFGKDWYWPDLVVIALLALGFWRGRKRGMSNELLPLIKLLIIVIAGSFVYKPAGEWFRSAAGIDRWVANFLVYLTFAFVMHLIFSWIKRGVGEKLVSSDIFGSMEY